MNGATLNVKPGGETGRILANANSKLAVEGGTVASKGVSAIALYNSSAVIENSRIIAQADPSNPSVSAFGIRLSGIESASSAQVSNSFVSGIDRGINVTDSATLVLNNSVVEGHAGASGSGFVTGGAGVVIAGANATIANGSRVTGDNNGIVMWADATGATEKSASLVLDRSSVTGSQGSALVVTRTAAADKDVNIEIRNGSTLSGGNGTILSVEREATAHVNVLNSQLVGDVVVSEGGTANLGLSQGASLTGVIKNATRLAIDNTSFWHMAGDSSVGTLALHGGTVDLRGTDAQFHTLSLGTLSGGGTFALGTDLASGLSDFIDISGAATGNHQLLVENSGVELGTDAGAQRLVHMAQGDGSFSLIGGQVDVGTFAYLLESGQSADGGTDWSLVRSDRLSNASRAAVGLFSAASTVWYGESTTLRSRMGELRNGNDQGGGWVRSYGSKQNISALGGVTYKQLQRGVSFGADGAVSTADGQWLLGVMGGYSTSDLDMKHGTTGSVDSYYIGAYSTWLADDGFYIDALIKANRFQNAAEVRMADGQKTNGDYNSVGVGASVEVGKHFELDEDWFVEPFAQASGLLVSGESYRLDNGLRASSNQADSLLGKVGAHLGRTLALDDGDFVEPYVKAAVAHEFVTSNRVSINNNRFTNDLSGSRIELGVGVAAQVNDVLQVHADIDVMTGRHIDQPWGVSLGARYSW